MTDTERNRRDPRPRDQTLETVGCIFFAGIVIGALLMWLLLGVIL